MIPLFLRWSFVSFSFFDRLNRISVLRIFLLLLLLQTALHLRYMNDPPNDYHQWRQVHGYAFARNFSENGMNVFSPQVDDRGTGDGVNGLEFPLMYYLTAIGYLLFGIHWWIARLVALLFSFSALWYCFQWVQQLFHLRSYGWLATTMLLFNPLFVYYSGLLMSDVPMLAGILMSLYYWEKWRVTKNRFHLFLSVFGLFIAALLKIYAFFILLYFAYTLWQDRKQIWYAIALNFISIVLVSWWYLYIIHIDNVSRLPDFPLPPPFPTDPQQLFHILKKVLLQWLPEMVVSYPQFILLIFGLIGLGEFRKQHRILNPFFLLFSIGAFALLGKTLERLEYHDYYFILILPVVLLVLLSGMQWLRTRIELKKSSGWSIVFLLLLITIPVVGSYRGLSRCETGRASLSPDVISLESAIESTILPNDLVVVASDPSPCILLYFAHRKGWSIEEDIGRDKFVDMIKHGAKYLISNSRALDNRTEIASHLTQIGERGIFRVYSLH